VPIRRGRPAPVSRWSTSGAGGRPSQLNDTVDVGFLEALEGFENRAGLDRRAGRVAPFPVASEDRCGDGDYSGSGGSRTKLIALLPSAAAEAPGAKIQTGICDPPRSPSDTVGWGGWRREKPGQKQPGLSCISLEENDVGSTVTAAFLYNVELHALSLVQGAIAARRGECRIWTNTSVPASGSDEAVALSRR